MKSKIRHIIAGILYVAAIICFVEAIMVTNGGSFFDLSGLARMIFCGLAAICVIAATLIWKAKDSRGKRNKVIVMIVAIAVIIGGGCLDNYLASVERVRITLTSGYFSSIFFANFFDTLRFRSFSSTLPFTAPGS